MPSLDVSPKKNRSQPNLHLLFRRTPYFGLERSPVKNLLIPALLFVMALALAVSFSVNRLVTDDRERGNPVVRQANQVTLETKHAQRETLRRERSRELEDERKAAINLAGRMGDKVFSPPRMLLDGEEHLPSVLAKEAADMSARQLRVLVRELGENLEMEGTDRALLVTILTDAWLKEHEAGRARSLEQMLEIIAEALPALPPGYDMLPVSTAMGRSLEWDHSIWVDFMEVHWSRWSGNPNAEIMRRDLLSAVDDPQLRMRVERLPQAATGN